MFGIEGHSVQENADLLDLYSPIRLQAKKKPVKKIKASDLGVDLTPRLQTVKIVAPPVRQGGSKVCHSFIHSFAD